MSDTVFSKEAEFEAALIKMLGTKGWEKQVIKYPTEQDLIKNWAEILFHNNREIDRLNDVPMSETEMQQVLEQVMALRTPVKISGFINGGTISIRRDNPLDQLHYGKEISLKIYDRNEIAAGDSRYQIAEQPVYPARIPLARDRRGDLVLLINGMPVIHIELKRSGIPVSQACNQIEKYAKEGVFTGLFSMVQFFVAMTPEETVYFANPGPDGIFNHDYFFHWADFYNEPLNDWVSIAKDLISIPMAHQMIGFYTVADTSDGVLKVMRSYQYYAASRISDKVAKATWTADNILGGYIWHTTGSGKTLTSFKAAQLIAASCDADKVIFLMDRIELGTQSLKEYRSFATDRESVQATENTAILRKKLKSESAADTLIVTSIQKMSRIKEDVDGPTADDLAKIQHKRIVFVIDECHRSTFGDMLINIKETFPAAMFFGFTGTPIKDENSRKLNTTASILGDELHRYTLADGLRDKNVLGFDPYRVTTFKDKDLRKHVGLQQAKAHTVEEVLADENKSNIFYHYMNDVPMAGYIDDQGNYVRGIEDYVPNEQYLTYSHIMAVVFDIKDNWCTVSHNGKFHGIFATSSITEAIKYYRLLKEHIPELKVTALFDPGEDNEGRDSDKEEGLREILGDYNERYNMSFDIATHAKFKQDVSLRLAHKEQYISIGRDEKSREKQLDLLIVVNQMLTGFDSKWINTLYMDKVLDYANLIQAFSRTNRLCGQEKPFGIIRYYRKPHTMERNINQAIKLYSGDKPFELFVNKLDKNIANLNTLFAEIKDVFNQEDILDFVRLPDDKALRGKFAKLFKKLTIYLEAARLQGFNWDKTEYHNQETGKTIIVQLDFDGEIYHALFLRYQELSSGGGGSGWGEEPFDIDSHITEVDTGRIDADYMNSRFQKYIKSVQENAGQYIIDEALSGLQSTFSSLTQEQQRFAKLFIHDVQRGEAKVEDGMTIQDYIAQYQEREENSQIDSLVEALGIDKMALQAIMSKHVNEDNINENSQFSNLVETVDKEKAKAFLENRLNVKLAPFKVNIEVDNLLRKFILNGEL